MRLEYDRDADAIYIWLREVPYAYGEDLDHARRVDYGHDGRPIGVELLGVSRGVNLDDLPEAAAIARLLQSQSIKVFA
ncbi:MAG: DUF2283 domain-containing protein [Chloroflexi bacterium]|nr:DUF2283 domain-containing protein [Chloroflexota bacterium]